jgi:hypothetical protein
MMDEIVGSTLPGSPIHQEAASSPASPTHQEEEEEVVYLPPPLPTHQAEEEEEDAFHSSPPSPTHQTEEEEEDVFHFPPASTNYLPSTLPPRRQPILIYSQIHHPTEYQPTRYFYDPNTLFNETAFTLEGDNEYIILIQSVGFESNDNDITAATINQPNGPLEIPSDQEPQSICLLMRHLGPDVNLSVAPRTSLSFLLENANVSIRMCYISKVIGFLLLNDHSSIVREAMAAPHCNYLTTYSPYLRTATTVSQQAAGRHPLLLRRLLNLPRRGPASLIRPPNSE